MKLGTKILLIFLCLIVFLGGIVAVLYPMISNVHSEKHQSEVFAEYSEKIEEIEDESITAAREAAKEYNRMLASGELGNLFDSMPQYISLLNIDEKGTMCYVEVPRLDLTVAVYHGDTDEGLKTAAVHLFGTSLPVGGSSTHAVLSGHTGMASRRIFTDLPQMEEGDIFFLYVLGERLAYQVDQIKTVSPNDTSDISIVPGQDYVTLLTCTPYGINSHRLLVRGTRIDYQEAEEIVEQMPQEPVKSVWKEQYLKGILTGLFILMGIILVLCIISLIRRGVRKRRGRKNN